ncbi:glycoside hydrolase family 2 [candidate division KSB1 bacterium]|nr:glycoside hydrolase family 2 [candidate division KSB1 bacterium]
MKTIRLLLILIFINITSLLAAKTERLYLSGTDKDHTVNWEFFCTDGRNSGQWTTIPVPSCWEQHGFGSYNYGNDRIQADEQGKYRYKFRIPAEWAEKQIDLVFEGSMTDTEVWINGLSAGPKHQGAFVRFRYNITELVRVGVENLLEVTVSKRSSDMSVNLAERHADYWIFGGIFRPVYLEALPYEHIERTAINAQADGSFSVDVFLQNIDKAKEITCQIKTLNGEPVRPAFTGKIQKNSTFINLKTNIEQPLLWTAETPNLYSADIKLNGTNTIHDISEKFGFRTIEVRQGDGIYVNGQKIRLKGVDRHSFRPESGRTLSKQVSIEDVELMKDMNINAVRMSHYPPDAHFLDVCDSLGMYVLDELSGWQAAYSTPVGVKLVKEMVTRDVNHPCILFWDNGNEGGFNYELVPEFGKYDPQKRSVLHPWETSAGVNTTHYRTYKMYENLADGPDILLPTEIWHGLYDGGHGAGLADYWDMIQSKPLAAGCFLWVFADEGLVRTDMDGKIDVAGNQAPDGIVGPHHEKEGSFYAVKEIYSPVVVTTKQLPQDFDGRMNIENRYDFTDLSACTFTSRLVKYREPFETESGIKEKTEVNIRSVECPPHQSISVQLQLPEDYNEYDALLFSAVDPTGREIYEKSFALRKPSYYAGEFIRTIEGKTAPRVNDGTITVSAGETEFFFDIDRGKLQKVLLGDQMVSFGGPSLAAGGEHNADVKHYPDGDNYVIEVNFHSANFRNLKWTVYGSGWLKCEYNYDLYGYFDFMGLSFRCPEDKILGMKWLGDGPYRVWKNRRKGVTLNVWENEYNDTTPGESWDYPEFKGYYSDFNWAVINTTEAPITVLTETDDLFFRMLTPKSGRDPRSTIAPFPRGDISFLHGIAPIGTKFQRPENTGPSGEQNKANGEYGGVLYFYFGPLETTGQ